MTRKSPLPLRWHIHWKAASTSVPPPMRTVPATVLVVTSFALPTRKYEYCFFAAKAGSSADSTKTATTRIFFKAASEAAGRIAAQGDTDKRNAHAVPDEGHAPKP